MLVKDTSNPQPNNMARGRDFETDTREEDEEVGLVQLRLSPPKTRTHPVRPKPLELLRPDPAPRRSTDPSVAHSSGFQGYFAPIPPQTRPHTSHGRTRSPFSRSHLRSKSSGNNLVNAPVLTRARSMPNQFHRAGLDSLAPGNWSSAAFASPPRLPSPLRTPSDEFGTSIPAAYSMIWSEGPGANAVETIEEDSELDITPRAIQSPPHLSTASASFARSSTSRRRPASPLRSLMGLSNPTQSSNLSFPVATSESQATSSYSSSTNSPSLMPQKYNEAYPSLHHYASSSSFGSFPSTPTSQRSRSPSISSLDTIEDAPDLEYQAQEDARTESLRLAAERQERGEAEEGIGTRRRGSFDTTRGFGRGTMRERKRWSVCGAERRADLDLETIYED